MKVDISGPRSRSQAGSTMVEFGLVIIPLLALLFLTMDTAWALFARATLQNAVREGVRFGVTGQLLAPHPCLSASIQQLVQQDSFGFIAPSQASSSVIVQYFSPTTLAQINGAASTAGGNLLQVTVSSVSISSFAPIWRSANPLSLYASASDVMESPPNGIAPCP